MKWLALALIVFGVVIAIAGFRKLGGASFEDGSFVLAILGLGVGAVSVLAGVILFFVLVFMGI